jgi:hypothetical protein
LREPLLRRSPPSRSSAERRGARGVLRCLGHCSREARLVVSRRVCRAMGKAKDESGPTPRKMIPGADGWVAILPCR